MSREVPIGWRRSQLGDLIKLEYGRALAGVERREGAVPVFGSSGIVGYHDKAAAAGPSIVISRKGSLGGVFYVEGGFWPIDTTYFVVQRENSDWRWLTYLLKFASLERLNEATGVPGLNRDKAAKEEVFVPPLHEQRRIAEILSSVDEAIAATRAVIEQTRKVKQGVLERLLTKGIGHTRFKPTEIAEIPEGWEVVRLNHIAERTTYGFTNPMSTVEDGPWMITAANILEGKINYKSARKTDRIEFETLLSEKSKPAENAVLITKDGTLGRVAIVDKGDLCINQSVAVVTPNKSRILPRFLYWLLQSPSVQTRILAEAGGSTIKHIYISKLAQTVLQLPPLKEQEEIVRNIDLVEVSFERENRHFDAMLGFKSALMSELLTGRKRVTDVLPMAAE